MPLSANTGMKTSTTITVPKTIELRISTLAWKTTTRGCFGVSLCRLSFSRRKMFSTSTIASSTNSPMATASPPKVIVLIERPSALNTNPVVTIERGIAVSVMKVVRKFSRNKNSITTTSRPPSRSASTTLATARSMKTRC